MARSTFAELVRLRRTYGVRCALRCFRARGGTAAQGFAWACRRLPVTVPNTPHAQGLLAHTESLLQQSLARQPGRGEHGVSLALHRFCAHDEETHLLRVFAVLAAGVHRAPRECLPKLLWSEPAPAAFAREVVAHLEARVLQGLQLLLGVQLAAVAERPQQPDLVRAGQLAPSHAQGLGDTHAVRHYTHLAPRLPCHALEWRRVRPG
mmetsp:Transcript_34680/g.104737  ORF Transcript_34680/g.104737 Transcript_34680/m.104737 type:complete len:207 (-) Transcript_34680:503-1123(-)